MSSYVERAPALLAWCLVAAPPAYAKGALEIEEIRAETYTEQIVAIADLSDGTYVKVRFGVSNVGPGDGKGACQILVVDKEGASWDAEQVVDRDDWRYDAKADALQMGPCRATTDRGLTLVAPLEAGRVEMHLDGPAARDRAHEAHPKGGFYELDILVKWAPARVKIVHNGRTRELTGFGYADHPRSRTLPQELAKSWVRFRGLNQDDPRLVLIRTPPRGPATGWHEAKKGRSRLDRVLLAPTGTKDNKGWRTRFKGPGGEWRIRTQRLLMRSAPVEEQGAILRSVIGAIVGNPVTYTFRGVLEERGTRAKIPGIVEITLTDE